MDGLLVVDKPSGPTSHDVVARLRRVLRERRIGHTGTLDPMASGVLPLVVGRATRLARFMTADEKRYEAIVRFGVATDTCDAMGQPVSDEWTGPMPDAAAIDRALERFRGTFLQQPPAYSAKKIGGRRSYQLARARTRNHDPATRDAIADSVPLPSPAEVTAFALTVRHVADDRAWLEVVCSSGFYVRALAQDLGHALGVGAHLVELRRTATSGVTLTDATPLDALERAGADAVRSLIPIDRMLPELPVVALTECGVRRVATGQDVAPNDAIGGVLARVSGNRPVRLTDGGGRLLAIAWPSATAGLLHPAVVLM